jgi:hypothetical protein
VTCPTLPPASQWRKTFENIRNPEKFENSTDSFSNAADSVVGSNGAIYVEADLPVVAGTTYTFGFLARKDASQQVKSYLQLDVAGQELFRGVTRTPDPGEYLLPSNDTEYFRTYTATTTGTITVRFRVTVLATTANTIYNDDLVWTVPTVSCSD